ncbi:MAG: ATP-binding protein [Deltaproteobacteria bacterium]|nr:ATP-binding protein [Deltaproteobacteria bacterium]
MHPQGAVFDEVQNAPDLLGYLQVEVDERPEAGRFLLTGSQHFGLSDAVAQSLAGRAGVLHLLPLSLDEVRRFPSPPADLLTTLFTGGYPRIHDRGIPAERWLSDYVTTYVQRDVRQVLNVGDLESFSTFVRLCAGRSGQELNLSALGADAGIAHNTARAWLSVLETSFLCFRLPAWHANLNKQLVKAPKLHFLDSGLLCHLLGIREPGQLAHHPLRGAIFESWVVSEVYKVQVHAGREPRVFHFRESRGLEVDLLLEEAGGAMLTEIKSGATVASDFFEPLRRLSELLRRRGLAAPELRLVYGGDEAQRRTDVEIVPWGEVAERKW